MQSKQNYLNRGQLIKLIHVAKRELKLDDDTYQTVIYTLTKQTSCADCSVYELQSVLNHFKSKGFMIKPSSKKRHAPTYAASKSAFISKIWKLWHELARLNAIQSPSAASLDAYVKRMSTAKNGVGVERVQWLNTELAQHVIECLKKWVYRVQKQ